MTVEEIKNQLDWVEQIIDEKEMEQQETMEARDECGVLEDGVLVIKGVAEEVAFQVLNEQVDDLSNELDELYAEQEQLEKDLNTALKHQRTALKHEKRHLLRSLLRSRINAQ